MDFNISLLLSPATMANNVGFILLLGKMRHSVTDNALTLESRLLSIHHWLCMISKCFTKYPQIASYRWLRAKLQLEMGLLQSCSVLRIPISAK